MRRFRSLTLGVLFVGWLATFAAADTGGSMGGGSWGGGGGGGGYSGGGGGYSGGGSYSYSGGGGGGYSYSGGGGGSSGGGEATLVGVVVLLAIVGMVRFAELVSSHTPVRTGYVPEPGFPASDVSVLRIALDGRARTFVQRELARIAKVADTATAEGRHRMLSEVGLMLRRVRDAWVYGGAVNEPMRTMDGSRAVFERHVAEARAKFRDETIRNAGGVITETAAPTAIPRSHEGAGLILVSIIVAARSELFTVKNIGHGEDLRQALEAASHRSPSDLIAIEIVWQPSDDADRLSSIELEAKYPRPALLPIHGALVGKAFCTYCGGPFPAELVTCPHCGAPAAGHDRAA